MTWVAIDLLLYNRDSLRITAIASRASDPIHRVTLVAQSLGAREHSRKSNRSSGRGRRPQLRKATSEPIRLDFA